MPDPLDRLRNYGPETGYASPLVKKVTPIEEYRRQHPLKSPEEIKTINEGNRGINRMMPSDRTDRFTNPFEWYPKPPTWDEEKSGLWHETSVPRWAPDFSSPYVRQRGREMPEGRGGYYDPWADPPPTDLELGRILGANAPTPTEKFIRENSNMINQ